MKNSTGQRNLIQNYVVDFNLYRQNPTTARHSRLPSFKNPISTPQSPRQHSMIATNMCFHDNSFNSTRAEKFQKKSVSPQLHQIPRRLIEPQSLPKSIERRSLRNYSRPTSRLIDEQRVNDGELSKANFKFHFVLGKGGFGKVWRVEMLKSRKLYAMKEMSKAKYRTHNKRVLAKKSVNSVLNERVLLS